MSRAADVPLVAGPGDDGTASLAGEGPEPAGLSGAALVSEPAPAPGELVVLARAQWPDEPGAELPAIGGFVVSSFSPLAAELAEQCLRRYFGAPPADPARGQRTAVLLASATGDLATAAAVASAVDSGRRVPPLLFYQSNQNAVVGHIASRWGLAGPVVCTVPVAGALADAMSLAALLIEDGDAAAALVIVANQGIGAPDHGTAVLLGPASWPDAGPPGGPAGPTVFAGDHPAVSPEPASEG